MIYYEGDPWALLLSNTLFRWKNAPRKEYQQGSTTKMEVQIRENRRQEIAQSMVDIMSALRLRKYDGHQVRAFEPEIMWLDHLLDDWQDCKDKANDTPDRDYWEFFWPIIDGLISDPELEKWLEGKRRERVLIGEEEPVEGDTEWLLEEARKHDDEAQKLGAVAESARERAKLAAERARASIPEGVGD